MSHPVLVWGAGGHGRVVADAATSAGFDVLGFIDRDVARVGTPPAPGFPPVAMSEEELLDRLAGDVSHLPLIVPGIGTNEARLGMADRLGDRCAPPIVHHDASVSQSASVDAGTVVLARAVVNANARIGRAVIVNTGAIIEHDCILGDGVHVSPGAILTGNVTVGARSWVGAGAIVIPGITIGEDAIVGAGAVVTRDVPSSITVVGNPARRISRRT